jgi:hypothetical protein
MVCSPKRSSAPRARRIRVCSSSSIDLAMIFRKDCFSNSDPSHCARRRPTSSPNRLIAQEHNHTAIAERLTLSPQPVSNHVSNIFSKLQMADRVQAIIRARDWSGTDHFTWLARGSSGTGYSTVSNAVRMDLLSGALRTSTAMWATSSFRAVTPPPPVALARLKWLGQRGYSLVLISANVLGLDL